ncbi:hypothetical protein E3N88_28866 [Mikania micrantha]|uniref:Uncharacterized protein n=1 Tax=Mikania micrantha TaxID=192012 RepID=A0A5N6N3H7_9ASTR|nr:hypothetical protein E3N88_28866 [Mikania micrantha]
MVNVGENRAQNGVTDCPETRNEDKNRKIDENGLGRYAPSHMLSLGDAPGSHENIWMSPTPRGTPRVTSWSGAMRLDGMAAADEVSASPDRCSTRRAPSD